MVDKILSDIPAFKTSGRSESALTLADYSGESLEIVNKRFSDWFVWGGYVMAESLVDLEGFEGVNIRCDVVCMTCFMTCSAMEGSRSVIKF